MCKSYKVDMSTVKKKKKKKNQPEENQDLMFINAEDELLCQVIVKTVISNLVPRAFALIAPT